ncbi:hypothetical protein F5878DRAFT_506370, partial [Lentinula raphanica]
EEEVKTWISEDVKEFFALRNPVKAEVYFAELPLNHHHSLVNKLVGRAMESKEAEATLVSDFLQRAASKQLCLILALEEGFLGVCEVLDDIAIDAPNATERLAVMMKGVGFGEEQRRSIASKSCINGKKLLALLS